MKAAVGSLVALLLVVSCSKVGTPTEPVLGTGRLVTTVLDANTHSGIANVTVQISRVGSAAVMTAMTNASGVAEIELQAGTYSVQVVPPAGYAFAGGKAELGAAQLPVSAGATSDVTVPLTKL